MSEPKVQIADAVAARDAAYHAWLGAASPATPGGITMLIDADKADKIQQAWDAWAAACRVAGDNE